MSGALQFSYNCPTNGYYSYTYTKDGITSPSHVFTPYSIRGISETVAYNSSLVFTNTSFERIQVVNTPSFKRLYVFNTYLYSSSVVYYNWVNNGWDFANPNITNTYPYTTCKMSYDGTLFIFGTGINLYYVYPDQLDVRYTIDDAIYMDGIGQVKCHLSSDISDDKSRLVSCWKDGSENYYFGNWNLVNGNYVADASVCISNHQIFDIACTHDANTVFIATHNGYSVYDYVTNQWILRTTVSNVNTYVTGLCLNQARTDDIVFLALYFTYTNYTFFYVSHKQHNGTYSTPTDYSNPYRDIYSNDSYKNNKKNICIDFETNEVLVCGKMDLYIYKTKIYSINNYVSSPATNGTYTITNLDSGIYNVDIYSTDVTTGNITHVIALNNIQVYDVPTEPIFTNVSVGKFESIQMFFNKPISDGSSAIIDYQYSLDNGITYKSMGTTTDGSYVITDSSIIGGNEYAVRLRAINSIGASFPAIDSYANPVPYTYADPPIVEFWYPTNSIMVYNPYLSLPAYNGGSEVTDAKYDLYINDVLDKTNVIVPILGRPSASLYYLTCGDTYRLNFYSVNGAGKSILYSDISFITKLPPPVISVSTLQNNQIDVSYTLIRGISAYTNNIIKYKYSLDGINYNDVVNYTGNLYAGSFSVGNIPAGNHTFYMRAYNMVDSADASANFTIIGTPEPPVPVSLTSDNDGIHVNYSYPNNDGYSKITDFLYSFDYTNYIPLLSTYDSLPTVTGTNYTVQHKGFYKLYVFESNGSFTLSSSATCKILIVGGGGGGGQKQNNQYYTTGGGGAAGGVGVGEYTFNGNITYNVTIGMGGPPNGFLGTNGEKTSIIGNDGTNINAYGGGAGSLSKGGSNTTKGSFTGNGNITFYGNSGSSISIYNGWNGISSISSYGKCSNSGGGAMSAGNSIKRVYANSIYVISYPYNAKGGDGYVWNIDGKTYGKGGNSGNCYDDTQYTPPVPNSGNGGTGGNASVFISTGGNGTAGSSGIVILAFYCPPVYTYTGLPPYTATNVYLRSQNSYGTSTPLTCYDPAVVTYGNTPPIPTILNIYDDLTGLLRVTFACDSTYCNFPITTFLYSLTGEENSYIDLEMSTPQPFSIGMFNKIYLKSRNSYGDSAPYVSVPYFTSPSFQYSISSYAGYNSATIHYVKPDSIVLPILKYQYSIDYGNTYNDMVDTNGNPIATDGVYTIQNLIHHATYTIYIRAVDVSGNISTASIDYTTITMSKVPGLFDPPTVSVIEPYNDAVHIRLELPTITATIVPYFSFGYRVEGMTDYVDIGNNRRDFIIDGLLPSKEYRVYFYTVNDIGFSNPEIVTFRTTFSPPIITNVTNYPLKVEFTAPITNGIPIVKYMYSFNLVNGYTDISYNNGVFNNGSGVDDTIVYLKASNGYYASEPAAIYISGVNIKVYPEAYQYGGNPN